MLKVLSELDSRVMIDLINKGEINHYLADKLGVGIRQIEKYWGDRFFNEAFLQAGYPVMRKYLFPALHALGIKAASGDINALTTLFNLTKISEAFGASLYEVPEVKIEINDLTGQEIYDYDQVEQKTKPLPSGSGGGNGGSPSDPGDSGGTPLGEDDFGEDSDYLGDIEGFEPN